MRQMPIEYAHGVCSRVGDVGLLSDHAGAVTISEAAACRRRVRPDDAQAGPARSKTLSAINAPHITIRALCSRGGGGTPDVRSPSYGAVKPPTSPA